MPELKSIQERLSSCDLRGGSQMATTKKRPLPILTPPPDHSEPSSPLPDQIGDTFLLEEHDSSMLVVGRELGHNKIREIGRGRYGTVDLMKEPRTGFRLAVKRIRESIECQDGRYLEREVRACLNCQACPFLVRCYGVMRLEGDVWICMEVMDSSVDRFYRMCMDLSQRIPDVLLARITHSMLSGLAYLVEELQLMHRDVKPSNMLISRAGRVKLCDYGVSGVLESKSMEKTIKAGCQPYMAPERVDREHPAFSTYDERSDVWSLGISLFEIGSGSHPYGKWKNPFQQIRQVVHEPAPRLPPDTAHYSDAFAEFVHLCLTKSYEDRPQYGCLLCCVYMCDYVGVSSPSVDSHISEFVTSVLDRMQENERLVLTGGSSQ